MKRLLALVLVLCLAVGLCACGGSEAPQSQESAGTQGNSEELYEKSGTLEDGTVFTTYRRGGPEGTPAKLVYDTPDGTHCEETYGLEGNLEHSITVYADGTTYEVSFYPSGSMEKSIAILPDGSYEEIHFLDNGYVDENGWITSGTVSYEKHVSADGTVTERAEDMELEEDGTWWITDQWDDGTVFRVHCNPDGTTMEQYQDNEETGMHSVTMYYENGNEKFKETRYDNSEKYILREFYENGVLKYQYYRNEDGTDQEEKVTEEGITTYFRSQYIGGEMEFFADDQGNLLKYTDNGKVYEGGNFPGNTLQIWESMKRSHAPDEGETVTEEDSDGTYWKTTTYRSGKVVKEHYSAENVLLSQEITDSVEGDTYLEFYSSGNIRYQKHTFAEKTFEFTYDEEGYEIYYHETGGGQEVEMFADENGMLVTILVNGVEKTGNDFLWFSTGHNFRSVKQ